MAASDKSEAGGQQTKATPIADGTRAVRANGADGAAGMSTPKRKKVPKEQRAEGPMSASGQAHAATGAALHDLARMRHDPDAVRHAFESGAYPYKSKMRRPVYERHKAELQAQLLRVQAWLERTGGKIVVLFEGRDAAGKGGTIKRFTEHLNPRSSRVVALSKPTEREVTQWYFQRYIEHLPAAGEIVFFDRSWYNRAGVEPVMGFCTPEEHRAFLQDAPDFERMLVDQGIHIFKFWLNIGQVTQLKRFFERRHNPLKIWKLSPIDYKAMHKWDDFTKARDQMFDASHQPAAPWSVVRANDKRRARLNIIRHVLDTLDYPGKKADVVLKPDPLILGGPELLGQT